MSTYKFVKFEGNYPRGDTKIAINKSGLIRLSSGFCRIININTYKYVVLFFDTLNKAIAIKFINGKESGRLTITRDRTAATISATSFMRANNIDLKNNSGRYDWKKQTVQDIGEVFIISLNKK